MNDIQLEQTILNEIKEYFDIIKIEKLTKIIEKSAAFVQPEHIELMDKILEKN